MVTAKMEPAQEETQTQQNTPGPRPLFYSFWNLGFLGDMAYITWPNAGFNLNVGCFGPTLSKIAPNGQIWEFTGSLMDHSSPNYVARLFYFEKIKKNDNMVQKNTNMLLFVKKSFRSYMPNPKAKNNKCSNIIHPKIINSIIYN